MKRRGFFIMEAVVGMMLLAAIAASLAITLSLRNSIHQRADARARAADRAESALISLQNGSPSAPTDISIETLDAPAPPPFRWVRVSAVHEQQRVDLVGLVPEEARR